METVHWTIKNQFNVLKFSLGRVVSDSAIIVSRLRRVYGFQNSLFGGGFPFFVGASHLGSQDLRPIKEGRAASFQLWSADTKADDYSLLWLGAQYGAELTKYKFRYLPWNIPKSKIQNPKLNIFALELPNSVPYRRENTARRFMRPPSGDPDFLKSPKNNNDSQCIFASKGDCLRKLMNKKCTFLKRWVWCRFVMRTFVDRKINSES